MIRITDASELIAITDLVHDLLFDVEDLLGQDGTTVEVPLWQGKRVWFWESSSERLRMGTLIVHNVVQKVVSDREQVRYYAINRVIYNAPYICITTDIPIDVRIQVSAVDIEAERL